MLQESTCNIYLMILQNVGKENCRTDASEILAQIFMLTVSLHLLFTINWTCLSLGYWITKQTQRSNGKQKPESDILVNKVFFYLSWNNFSFFFWFILVITSLHNVSLSAERRLAQTEPLLITVLLASGGSLVVLYSLWCLLLQKEKVFTVAKQFPLI